MVSYNYDLILGQQVSFAPANDVLRIESSGATVLSFEVVGVTLRLTNPSGIITLDATPLFSETSLALFTPTNIIFSGGSLLAVGDLTDDDSLDGGDNTINFTTNTLLTAALNANNQVHGLGGNDTINLTGSTGSHLIFGGAGGDTITSGNGNSSLYGGSGKADTLDGADSFIVGNGNNTIYGNAGNDAVSFSATTALGNMLVFYGGTGGDSLTANNAIGKFEIYAGPDNDVLTLTNAGNNNTIYGGAGGDTIDMTGSYGNNLIYGGSSAADTLDGADSITLGGGSNTLFTNAGNDAVLANVNSNQTATIYLGAGADSLTSGVASGTYSIIGGSGGDNINLTNHFGNATIYGGSSPADSTDGGDTIIGSSGGNNLIYGNSGNDLITVRAGSNETAFVYAGSGNDTITAAPTTSAARIELYGNSGNDVFALDFTSAAPLIRLKDYGTGENNIDVTLNGGVGAASLHLSRSNDQTLIRSTAGGEQMVLEGFTGNFTKTSFEIDDGSALITNFGNAAAALAGTEFNDQLIAGNNGDSLTAGAGDDLLIGGGGRDRFIFATANFDSSDTVRGGAGNDFITLGTPGTPITDAHFANTESVEVITLLSGDYSINGLTLGTQSAAAGIFGVDASAATTVTADLIGSTRYILYVGGTLADDVNGTNFGDNINGRNGDDIIAGNRGADTLTGGDGDDIFAYNENGGVEGGDVIRDIDFGTASTFVDRIQINASAAGYNLGDLDAVVDGAIITRITDAGAAGTELIILKSVGIATANITSSLDMINADVASTRGTINLFFDSTLGRAVMYHDVNGNQTGGHILMATLENITQLSGMDNLDFNDFIFV